MYFIYIYYFGKKFMIYLNVNNKIKYVGGDIGKGKKVRLVYFKIMYFIFMFICVGGG